MKSLAVIKVGGQILEDIRTRDTFLGAFASIKGNKVLVHGGGRLADSYLKQLGIAPRMIEGRRLTDSTTLDVVTMVYGGLVNKQIVALLQACNINAVGISGADGNSIIAHQRPVGNHDYGYVGDITRVNTHALHTLLESGYVPVVCPLTHNGQGQLLNTNADTIAMEIAGALAEHYRVSLCFCIEFPGVMTDRTRADTIIPVLDPESYREYKKQHIIVDGMLPKVDNAFAALDAGVAEVVIGGIDTFQNPELATRITL